MIGDGGINAPSVFVYGGACFLAVGAAAEDHRSDGL